MKKLFLLLTVIGLLFGSYVYSTSGSVHSVIYDHATKFLNFNIRGDSVVQTTTNKFAIQSWVSTTGCTQGGDDWWISCGYVDLTAGVWILKSHHDLLYGASSPGYTDYVCTWTNQSNSASSLPSEKLLGDASDNATLYMPSLAYPYTDFPNSFGSVSALKVNCHDAIVRIDDGKTQRVYSTFKPIVTTYAQTRLRTVITAVKISD